MKRFFPVVLAFVIIIPALLLPAAAAGSEEFIFEFYESVTTFSDYPFDNNVTYYLYNGILPEGQYTIDFVLDPYYKDLVDIQHSDVISIVYDDYISGVGYGAIFFTNLTMISAQVSQTFLLETFVIPFTENSESYTLLGIKDSDISEFYFIENIIFRSYDLNNEISNFVFSVSSGFADMNSDTIMLIMLVAISITATPVICWLGYRFMKSRIVKSFKKGKL